MNSKINQPTEILNPFMKAAIRSHTNDVLSGNYPDLHMTPESELNYTAGFLAGVTHGLQMAHNMFDEKFLPIKEEEPPTLNRQTEIVLDEENARTLHY